MEYLERINRVIEDHHARTQDDIFCKCGVWIRVHDACESSLEPLKEIIFVRFLKYFPHLCLPDAESMFLTIDDSEEFLEWLLGDITVSIELFCEMPLKGERVERSDF